MLLIKSTNYLARYTDTKAIIETLEETTIHWLHLGRNKKDNRRVIAKINKAIDKIKSATFYRSYKREIDYYLAPYILTEQFKTGTLNDYTSSINQLILPVDEQLGSPFLADAVMFVYGYSLRQFFMLDEHQSSKSAIAESVRAFNQADGIASTIDQPLLRHLSFLSLVDSYYHSYDTDLFSVQKDVPSALKTLTANSSILVSEYAKQLLNETSQLSIGQVAPNFVLSSYEGDSVSLADLRGKYIYLDFWFSKCHPCIRAMEELKTTYQDYGNNIEFVSINGFDTFDKGKQIAKKRAFVGTKLHAGKNHKTLQRYNVNYYPTYYLISPEGKIVYKPVDYYKEEFEKVRSLIQ